jgi:hypothetical protein
MINLTIEEFINTLKPLVSYNKKEKRHYMGSTVLTNQELNGMLEVLLEDKYTKLNGTQREKMRERVFKDIT